MLFNQAQKGRRGFKKLRIKKLLYPIKKKNCALLSVAQLIDMYFDICIYVYNNVHWCLRVWVVPEISRSNGFHPRMLGVLDSQSTYLFLTERLFLFIELFYFEEINNNLYYEFSVFKT